MSAAQASSCCSLEATLCDYCDDLVAGSLLVPIDRHLQGSDTAVEENGSDLSEAYPVGRDSLSSCSRDCCVCWTCSIPAAVGSCTFLPARNNRQGSSLPSLDWMT